MTLYTTEIYRTKDAIVLHRVRSKRVRSTLPLAYVVTLGFILLVALAMVFVMVLISLLLLGILALPVLLQRFINSRELAVSIDRQRVRMDRLNQLGICFTNQKPRKENIEIYQMMQREKSRIHFYVRIENGKQIVEIPVSDPAQGAWIVKQFLRYLEEIPSRPGANEVNFSTNLLNALAAGTLDDQVLHRIQNLHEKIVAENGKHLKQGRLKVFCERCEIVIPEASVLLEDSSARTLATCPQCRMTYEIPALKIEEPTPWMRAKVHREGNVLRIEQRFFGWAPLVWTTMLTVLALAGGSCYAFYRMLLDETASLSEEQLQQLYYGMESFPWGMFHFGVLIAILSVSLTLFALGMVFYRYRLEITPYDCVYEQKLFFWKRKWVFPRTALRKYVSNSVNGILIFRDDYIVFHEGDKLNGTINRYLLTVPPAETLAFEPGDVSVEDSFLAQRNDEIVPLWEIERSC